LGVLGAPYIAHGGRLGGASQGAQPSTGGGEQAGG
jgi:hypothetical protein